METNNYLNNINKRRIIEYKCCIIQFAYFHGGLLQLQLNNNNNNNNVVYVLFNFIILSYFLIMSTNSRYQVVWPKSCIAHWAYF